VPAPVPGRIQEARDILYDRLGPCLRAGSAAPAASTVAEIALDCGFEHLGRFSARHRARFGEGPAETRQRARELTLGARTMKARPARQAGSEGGLGLSPGR
jgi:AraC-like DNA-binding protein